MNISDLNIYFKNSICEDAINLLKVSGNINNINIDNSLSDALDVDFSNIDINKINIKNAYNDCLDFSFGNYVLNNTNLNSCGDKSISLGEQSNTEIDYLEISDSYTGVAIKDSSFAIINDLFVETSKNCILAYRKKQEFYGALIKTKNIVCNSANIFIENGSEIKYF